MPSPTSSTSGVSGASGHNAPSNLSVNATPVTVNSSGMQMAHQAHSHHQQQGQHQIHNSSVMQQVSQSPPSPPSLINHSLAPGGHHSYSSVNSNLTNSNGTRYPNVNFLSFYGRNHHRTLEGELAPSPISSSSDELNIANGTSAKEYINSTLGHEVLTPTTILEGDIASIHGRAGDSLIQLTDLESRHQLHQSITDHRSTYGHHHHHHHSLYSSGHHEHGHHHRHRRGYHPYAHHATHGHGHGLGHGNNLSPPASGDCGGGGLYCEFTI